MFRGVHSNSVSVLGQLLIIAWTIGLQLYLVGTFGKPGGVTLGVVLTALTVALLVWTIRLIASEVRITWDQNNKAETEDSQEVTAGQPTENAGDVELELVTLTLDDETAQATEDKETASTEQQEASAPTLRGRAPPPEEKTDEEGATPPLVSLPWSLIVGNALCGSGSAEDDTEPTVTT